MLVYKVEIFLEDFICQNFSPGCLNSQDLGRVELVINMPFSFSCEDAEI